MPAEILLCGEARVRSRSTAGAVCTGMTKPWARFMSQRLKAMQRGTLWLRCPSYNISKPKMV